MLTILPWLIAMAVLIACSAFFSASEAALFSLRPADRKMLQAGTTSQQQAARLLDDPERVLSAVLFWNLVVNIAYFAIASIVENQLTPGSPLVWPLRIGSLLIIIFCSEMLPKTVAVLTSRRLSASVSLPLTIMVRMVDPIMPVLSFIMKISRRLLWPTFEEEASLETADLERAIELSTGDAKLLHQEQTVLHNIVSLSSLRADEAMRPRPQLQMFKPPVSVDDIAGQMDQSGYLFITEEHSDNITGAVRLQSLYSVNPLHLEAEAEKVVYVPWCATIGYTYGLMKQKDRDVAVVVNEWGDTIGALTGDDFLDLIFTDKPSRSQRLLNRAPIQQKAEGLWTATSMTNIRRLEEYFQMELPESHNKTIGGVMQESLQRMPQVEDVCHWGPFTFEITEVRPDGQLTVDVRIEHEDPRP